MLSDGPIGHPSLGAALTACLRTPTLSVHRRCCSSSSDPYTVRTQALVTDCGSLHYPRTFLERITGSCLTPNSPDHVGAVCAGPAEPGRHRAQRWPLCPVRWRSSPYTRIRLAVGRRFPVGVSAYGEEEEFCRRVLRHQVKGPSESDCRVKWDSTLSDLTRLNSNGARQREAPRRGAGEARRSKAGSGGGADRQGLERGRRRKARRRVGEAPMSKAGSGGGAEEQGGERG